MVGKADLDYLTAGPPVNLSFKAGALLVLLVWQMRQ